MHPLWIRSKSDFIDHENVRISVWWLLGDHRSLQTGIRTGEATWPIERKGLGSVPPALPQTCSMSLDKSFGLSLPLIYRQTFASKDRNCISL